MTLNAHEPIEMEIFMKLMTSVFTLLMCVSVFAQEKVLLESKKVTVNDTKAILVRTNKTPNKVKVTFSKVAFSESVCERYATRMVFRTSGSYCGYVRQPYRTTEAYCVSRNQAGRCTVTRIRPVIVYRSFARTCPVPENYCAQYGTAVQYDNDSVVIKFDDLPALGDSEEDTFVVTARQKNYGGGNVVYNIIPQDTVVPYKVKSTGVFAFLGVDRFKISVK